MKRVKETLEGISLILAEVCIAVFLIIFSLIIGLGGFLMSLLGWAGVLKLLTLLWGGIVWLLAWMLIGLFLIFCRPVNNPLTGVDRAPGSRWPGQKEAERLRNKEQGRRHNDRETS